MSRDGVRSEIAFLQSKVNELRDKIEFAPKQILVQELGDLADMAKSMAYDVDISGLEQPLNGDPQ